MNKWEFYTTNEIKAGGWLKKQLEIQANGLCGNLDKFWGRCAIKCLDRGTGRKLGTYALLARRLYTSCLSFGKRRYDCACKKIYGYYPI